MKVRRLTERGPVRKLNLNFTGPRSAAAWMLLKLAEPHRERGKGAGTEF